MVKSKKDLEKNFKQNPFLFVSIIMLLVLPLAFVALNVQSRQVAQTTVYNSITGTLSIYGDNSEGTMYELINEGDRTNSFVKAVVALTGNEGIDRIDCSLYAILEDGTIGAHLITNTMTVTSLLQRETTFDVTGWATGYYYLHLNGYVTTHVESIPEEVKNPDFRTWFDWAETQISTDVYIILDGIEYNYLSGPPEYITVYYDEVKDDVDMFLPEDRKVYVQTPDIPIVFTFTKTQVSADAPITFSYSITTGSISSYLLTIYDSDWVKVIDSSDIDNFIFNQNQGQADGNYHAKINLIGDIGWIGGYKTIDLTVDNPDSITGNINIYILQDGNWVLAGDTLSGDIKIIVTDVTGNPSKIYIEWDGPVFRTYDFVYHEDTSSYEVVVKTRELVNGVYDVNVIAIRSEDNAVGFLSSWIFGLGGSDKTPEASDDFPIFLGIIAVMGIITTVTYIATGGFEGKKGKRKRK